MLRSGVEIRTATVADALALAPRLRAADRAELEAAASGDIAQRLRQSVEASLDPQAVTVRGDLVMIFGVAVPDPFGATAVPWALGASGTGRLLATHKRYVLAYLARVRETFPHLVNQIDARNRRSARWLASLGFTIHPAVPTGVDGALFHRFEIGDV